MAFNPPKFVHKLLESCSPNPAKAGKTLLVINALGMVFAALSNTYAAAVDKNTSAQDKKFLVPAGFVTGAANIGLYYAMTTKIIDALQGKVIYNEDGTIKSVKNGLADKVLDYMSKNNDKDGKNLLQVAQEKFVAREIKKAGKVKKSIFGAETVFNENYVDTVKSTLKNSDGTVSDKAKDLFKSSFKSGFGVAGAFIGAVVGCAILTPIIRDISAYFVQKRLEKNNPEMKEKPYKPYFEPTRIESVRYNRRPLTLKGYMAFTNKGRMKV